MFKDVPGFPSNEFEKSLQILKEGLRNVPIGKPPKFPHNLNKSSIIKLSKKATKINMTESGS